MWRTYLPRLIYGAVAVFALYFTVARLVVGHWLSAVWPLIIAAFCVYRLVTIEDRE